MSLRRLSVLQWLGCSCSAAVAASSSPRRASRMAVCNRAPRSGEFAKRPVVARARPRRVAIVLAAEAAAFLVFRATRGTEEQDPRPQGRLHFFATAALAANFIFLMIIVLTTNRHDREYRVPAVVRRTLLLGLACALVAAGTAAAAPSPQLVHAGARLFGATAPPVTAAAAADPAREQNSGGGLDGCRTSSRAPAPTCPVWARSRPTSTSAPLHAPPPARRAAEARSHLLLTDGQIDALTAYVASLGPGPAIPTPHPGRGSLSSGMRLFTQHCSGCHQVAGRGRLRDRRRGAGARPGHAAPDRGGRSGRALPGCRSSRRGRSATRSSTRSSAMSST
jgi:mono/diheme cytochrome c family protein